MGAMGIKSMLDDLLVYMKALMNAHEDQISKNPTTTPGLPFAQISTLFQPQIALPNNSDGSPKGSFTFGWVRTKLSGTMSEMGINEFYVKGFPVISKGLTNSPTVYYHAGSVVGYLTSVTLIPETSSAVVVASNTLTNQDLPDWIGLLVLEALLEVPEPVDFTPLAKEAAETFSQGWPNMMKELEAGKKAGTPMKDAKAYIGEYFNKVFTWYF